MGINPQSSVTIMGLAEKWHSLHISVPKRKISSVCQQRFQSMPTGGKNFTSFVEGGPLWSEHDKILFSEAQVAAFFGRVKRLPSG